MPSPRLLPIVAIVGRPNVGKSTLFNRYAGKNRVLVKDTPGVTRDSIAEEIDLDGRLILLVDTAGLDPDADDALGSAVQAQAQSALEEADAILFVVDGKSGLMHEDEELANTLRRSSKNFSDCGKCSASYKFGSISNSGCERKYRAMPRN